MIPCSKSSVNSFPFKKAGLRRFCKKRPAFLGKEGKTALSLHIYFIRYL